MNLLTHYSNDIQKKSRADANLKYFFVQVKFHLFHDSEIILT